MFGGGHDNECKTELQMERTDNGNLLLSGTLDKKLWADDLDRMKKAGISVIRIAEFAWSKVEPEEGVFTYDFLMNF